MRTNAQTEDFEQVTVFGKPMLFTCLRIDRNTVPEGLFLYEVRHDDDQQGIPCEIAKFVMVNHWGTLISATPLPLVPSEQTSNAFLEVQEDEWNYEGVLTTMAEYISARQKDKEERRKKV